MAVMGEAITATFPETSSIVLRPSVLLEDEPYSKLQLPRRCPLGQVCDPSSTPDQARSDRLSARIDSNRGGRIQVLDVEYIEGLTAQLQLHIFSDWEALEQ
jgi:hypothetical protein